MRVFLDTNVIVAAVATRGLCADVFRETLARHDLIASEALFIEVRRALQDKLGVPAEIVNELVALLRESAHLSEPDWMIDLSIKDRADQGLVSAAIKARAGLFVTGDRELLDLKSLGKMEIVSPRAFWERIRGKAGD
jgi:putative PIN family toxin of toxin-antitoxin system